jgi:hypothetical protein
VRYRVAPLVLFYFNDAKQLMQQFFLSNVKNCSLETIAKKAFELPFFPHSGIE